MRDIIFKLSIVSGLALATTWASAADIDITITGSVRPAACSASIGVAGGVIDFGTIPRRILREEQGSRLPDKSVPFSVQCDPAVAIRLVFIDNQANSKVTGLGRQISSSMEEDAMMGLGHANGKNIGAYAVALQQSSHTSGSNALDTLFRRNTEQVWHKAPLGNFRSNAQMSWGARGTTTPAEITSVSGELAIYAVIDQTSHLDLRSEVVLDGKGTIELVYP